MKIIRISIPTNASGISAQVSSKTLESVAGRLWEYLYKGRTFHVFSTSTEAASFFVSGEGLSYIYLKLRTGEFKFIDLVKEDLVKHTIKRYVSGEIVGLPIPKNNMGSIMKVIYCESSCRYPEIIIANISSVLKVSHGNYIVQEKGYLEIGGGKTEDKAVNLTYIGAKGNCIKRKMPLSIVMKVIDRHSSMVLAGEDAFSKDIRFDNDKNLRELIGSSYINEILIPL